jgi:hypothetical protein
VMEKTLFALNCGCVGVCKNENPRLLSKRCLIVVDKSFSQLRCNFINSSKVKTSCVFQRRRGIPLSLKVKCFMRGNYRALHNPGLR